LSAAGGGSGGPALPGADTGHCGGSAQPDGHGAASAMHAALRQAGVAPSAVANICVSANGCAAVEAAEADALRQLFGDQRLERLTPATLCGDTQGACTALQAALAILRDSAAPELVLTTEASGASVALLLQTAPQGTSWIP
jgi:3-oxoacyl-(acyl-carrier-protein) synthase